MAALSRNRVIGRNNQLPWHLPADLRFFKQVTMGKPLLLGRKTWESIGHPLPGRSMIVMTQEQDYCAQGCTVVHSLAEGLTIAGHAEEVMVIGGASLYAQALPIADQLYLTRIEADIAGDTWFPAWQPEEWRLVSEEGHGVDDMHPWPFSFQRWVRRFNARKAYL